MYFFLLFSLMVCLMTLRYPFALDKWQQQQQHSTMGKLLKTEKSFFQKYRCPVVTVATLILSALLFTSQCPPQPTPVLSLADGLVQGLVEYSRNGSEYWSFRGIPYAQPPVKKLRFTPPRPNLPWEGVWKATKYSPHCKLFDSMVSHAIEGQEDCLYLNVFAHPIQENIKRPVLLYIMGGAFQSGGSEWYRPDYIMDHDIVLITFNYRLGPFGFINLETESGDGSLPRGNQGLKDQLLVLRWIKKHVTAFGGDPDRVTIYGQSAGSVSAHLHILSPASRGLFHRAIMQSGSSFCAWGTSSRPREISLKYVNLVGCPTDDRSAMLQCLQNVDADELVKHQTCLTVLDEENNMLLPSVERFQDANTFLAEPPSELARKGNFSKVPALFGMNEMEGAFRVARFDNFGYMIPDYESTENWTPLLNNFLGYTNISANIAQRIRNEYFGNLSFVEHPMEFKDKMTLLASYATVFEPVDRAAMFHAKASAQTYMYLFSYKPIFLPSVYGIYKAVGPNDWLPPRLKIKLVVAWSWIQEHFFGYPRWAPVHGDDLPQMWNLEGESRWLNYFETDFSEGFVQMVVDFAYGREPVTYRGTEWKPVNAKVVEKREKVKYMLLDNSKGNGKMVEDPFTDGINFWRNIGVQNFRT